MNDWREVRLDDIADIIGGGTPKTSVSEYWNGDIPWLSVVDFNSDNRYVYNTEKNITEKGLNNSSTKLLDKSDIIISARGTVGALAQLSKPMAFNQSCFGIRSNDRSTNDFLYYFLKNNVSKIQQNAHGSVFDTITMDSLKSTEILLPSLEEQGEIAGVLGALDDKIEANRKQNETLEAMAAAIFKSWFIDFEPFNSTMPSDWEEKALCDICKIVYGKGLPTTNLLDKGYPVFGGNGQIGFYSKYIYEEPQVIISCRGAASGKVMHSLKESFITNNSLVCEIKDKNELNRFYLERILKFIDMTRFTTGSAQPQITIENISNVLVLVPSEKVMYEFGKILEDIDAKITFNDECSDNLAQVRDSLLPRLMSGVLRLPPYKKD